MSKGHLFTFEGGEGAGKGTQIALLKKRLEEEGYNVSKLKYYEPGGTNFADMIRAILKKRYDTDYAKEHLTPLASQIDSFDLDPLSQAFLFFAARSHQFHEKVKKDVEEGNIVLLDRSIDSTVVYQGHAQDGSIVPLLRLANDRILQSAGVKITKTFYLDVPVEVAKQRVKARQEDVKDFFDQKDHLFYERIRQGFLHEWSHTQQLPADMEHHKRIELIDGTSSPEAIAQTIYPKVLNVIKQ